MTTDNLNELIEQHKSWKAIHAEMIKGNVEFREKEIQLSYKAFSELFPDVQWYDRSYYGGLMYKATYKGTTFTATYYSTHETKESDYPWLNPSHSGRIPSPSST